VRSLHCIIGVVASGLLAAGASPAQSQVKACSLLTRADAAQILAKPAIATAQVITDDEEDCGYLLAGFDLHTEVLRSTAGWSSSVKQEISQGKAESVAGIGDEAVFSKDGNGDYLIVARKGNRIVTVTMYASEGSAAVVKPKLVKLVTAAVAKLK
jgi:hypothetical protein